MVPLNAYPLVVLAAVVVFWLIPDRLRTGFLALVSLGILLAIEPLGVTVLVGWSLVFYYAAPRTTAGRRRLVFLFLVTGILAYLAFYKYVPPILARLTGRPDLLDFAIPLGISYFTFKLLHYAIEVRRGNLPDHRLADFLCYILLVPIFTAGPIERFDDFLGNRERSFRLDSTVWGLTRIVHGLVKKFVLVEVVLDGVERLGGMENLASHPGAVPPHAAWALCTLAYLYAYLDFSAYSDLAIGTSRLFGLRIVENFRWPIVARSIGDFWSRWHRSLANWCQTYVYLPLLGITRNPYVAAWAGFAAIGLWHAGTDAFLLWGLYHGTGVAVYQAFRRMRRRRRGAGRREPRLAGTITGFVLTQIFVVSSFAITIAPGPARGVDGLRVLLRLFGIPTGG